MRLQNRFLALAAAALLPLSLTAQVTTDPVGYKVVTINGDSGLTLLGIEFLGDAGFVGQASSVGASTVTVTGTDFDSLLSSEKSYFLDVTSGTNEGVNTSVSGWSGDTLSLGDDLTSILTPSSDTIRVYELPTISSIFGVGGDVLEGGSATTADVIYMPNPDGAGLVTIYYSTGGFTGTGWRQVGAGNQDKGDVPIYFSDGLYILKKSAGDSELVVSGTVKMTSSVVAVDEGFTPFSTIFPSGTTLGNSGLYDGANPSQSLLAGSATTADLVYTDSDGDGSIETYYYSSGGFTGIGWRQVGAGNADRSSIPLASAFGILRQSGSVALNRSAAY